MTRRGAYSLLAFGVGALCLGAAAKLLQTRRDRRPARLARKLDSHLGEMRRRTTAFDATSLVS